MIIDETIKALGKFDFIKLKKFYLSNVDIKRLHCIRKAAPF